MQVTITIPTLTTLLRQWRWSLLAALASAFVLAGGASPASAVGDSSVTSPDTGGIVGEWTSLALDGSGNPVVSYFDSANDDLKLLHCDDPNCTGGGESITAPATTDYTGEFTSLELDASGNPVVSFFSTNGGLNVLHCNDPNCSGGDESITMPDNITSGSGRYTSLELDASGNPVVSYTDVGNGDLMVLHCNDANCAGGDESIIAVDTAGFVGYYTSLALDGAGNPVVSYQQSTYADSSFAGDLKVLHCNDVNCSGGDESITAVDSAGNVGAWNSLALDASGNPVVSYADDTTPALKVLHCNDANCAGGDESITMPDAGVGGIGRHSSLTLDTSGNPVVSYKDDSSDDLKVMHCNDANCAGADESVRTPDTPGDVGGYTSVALDTAGNPVVSYYDFTNGDLKVLHCTDAACAAKPMPINVSNFGRYDLPKTCYSVRNDIQSHLFNVCDNDFQGPPESHSACLPDGVCEDEDPAEGRVSVTVDPAAYNVAISKAPPEHSADGGKTACSVGPPCQVTFFNVPDTRPWHPWDLTGSGGNPDGLVRIDDILAVIQHYFQDKPLP